MVTLAHVAARAGVSKATASRALSGHEHVSARTRERVLAAAQSLGYAPSTAAVSLATGRSNSIGVLMPTVKRWFFAEVLEGIQHRLLEQGIDLTLYNAAPGAPGRARVFAEFLGRKRFDGLIVVGIEATDEEQRILQGLGRPVVRVVGDPGAQSIIAIDDGYAARLATEHLIALGHQDIAFLGGDHDQQDLPHVNRRRYAGYFEAMTEAGIVSHARLIASGHSLAESYHAAADALSDLRRRPSGIVAVNDEVAISAIIAARRLGIRVPSDLSVIGIDDHELAGMFALTTLQQIPRDQGAEAVDLLLAHLADPELVPQTRNKRARLIVRSSTSAVPG